MGAVSDQSDPSLGGLESSVTATLSIDSDTLEQVHERLIRKGKQHANRAVVIDTVRGIVESIEVATEEGAKSVLTSADQFKLMLALNTDCDTVD